MNKTFKAERRKNQRFTLQQAVRYRAVDTAGDLSTGSTIDMSSRGVCFAADKTPPRGTRLHVAVDWPVALDAGALLQLVAQGRVVWSEAGRIAVAIERYEFRTRARVN